jgi:hypothetical protein
MLAPCSVTLAEPVTIKLAFLIVLNMFSANDIPALRLPCLAPKLILRWRVPIKPCPNRHRIDVSAAHVVRSHPVRPILVDALYGACPSSDPCTVTLDDPVPAAFVRLGALAMPRSTEKH